MAAVLAPRRVGRFTLLDELGRGAQATVWRAHDERLDREVALKLLHPGADSVAVNQWLHEARAVSRLSHPHIVPVFEADSAADQAYLVFELVRGPTLSALRRQRGALPAREAAELMLGVLAALRAAHEQGIVHRDLKPSNVLIDTDGRPRVMDFGIAARVSDDSDGSIVGTPGYISPEAARGLAARPCMDVFSAGLVLAELLTGAPLLREADPQRALARVQSQDMLLPEGVAVDDALRSLVNRAIARDPLLRFEDAAQFHAALTNWLHPLAPPVVAAVPGQASGTLAFLLLRMRHRSDFPALSEAVARIQRITASDSDSLGQLVAEIQKDVALTQKLLRLVNTAHFSASAGGGVSTLSRAVALVGFGGIRNLALSLVLVEHMKDQGQAECVKRGFLHALTSAQLASELSDHTREHEEAFLGGMFRNLGRLLAEYYFPEEARQVRERLEVTPSGHALPDASALVRREQMLAEELLGARYDVLALGVARSWGLPESLQQCMLCDDAKVPTRTATAGTARLRWLAQAADELAAALLAPADELSGPSALAPRLQALAERFGPALGLKPRDFNDAALQAQRRLVALVPLLGLARALPVWPAPSLAMARPGARGAAPPAEPDCAPTLRLAPLAEPTPAALRSQALLSAGAHDLALMLAATPMRVNEVLLKLLQTLHNALGLQRVLLCLRDARGHELQGRLGLGEQAMALAPLFRIPLLPGAAAPSLFSALCLKGVDTLITDASLPAIARRLPGWFVDKVRAPSFLLLPLLRQGQPVALIYADVAAAGALVLGEPELAQLRILRGHALTAVLALRPAG